MLRPLHTLLATLLDTVLPELCAQCRAPCSRGLCPRCRALLPRVPDPCPRCGLPGNSAHEADCQPLPGIAGVAAPFLFATPVSEFIHALKYQRRRTLGRTLGLALSDELATRLPPVDAWVPVPLHRSRLRDRTFNQAEEIALTLARRTDRPLLATTVARTRATVAQATLAASRRQANLTGAFRVKGSMNGLTLGIVDDVITTGATAGSLACPLLEAGATAVFAVAVARSVPDRANPSDAVPQTAGAAPRKM